MKQHIDQELKMSKKKKNVKDTSSAEAGVKTPFVSGNRKVAKPANPDSTAKIINVPFLHSLILIGL